MATAVTGRPVSWHKKFLFVVEIPSFGRAAFNKCSEISMEVEDVVYAEGGVLAPFKEPGMITMPDITLERGAAADYDIWQWFSRVSNVAANRGAVSPNHMKSITLVQKDRAGDTLRRIDLKECWPKQFVAGDWDNSAGGENVIEKLVLSARYFVVKPKDALIRVGV